MPSVIETHPDFSKIPQSTFTSESPILPTDPSQAPIDSVTDNSSEIVGIPTETSALDSPPAVGPVPTETPSVILSGTTTPIAQTSAGPSEPGLSLSGDLALQTLTATLPPPSGIPTVTVVTWSSADLPAETSGPVWACVDPQVLCHPDCQTSFDCEPADEPGPLGFPWAIVSCPLSALLATFD